MTKLKTVEFENKLLNSKHFEKGFTYMDLCVLCFNTPPKPGISIIEMGERIDDAKLYKASRNKSKIDVNEEQLELLLKMFPDKWHIVDPVIVEFYKYIKKLKEHF